MMVNVENRLPMAAVLLGLVLSVFWIIVGAQGVRGTDQYNYLADTETTLAAQAPVTNLLFPAKLIREGANPTPAWFHHNGPPIQVAAWLGRWTGAYHGWILMNLLAHLTVAVCVFALARKVADQRIAFWTTSLYLLSPSAIWLGINVLQEMFFAALLAIALTGFIYRSRPILLVSGSVALLVGVLCHPIFQAAALLLPLFIAIEAILARRYALSLAAVFYVGAVLYFAANAGSWFPSSFQPDLAAIITSSIPGESNMFWHYSLEQRSVTYDLLLEKLVASTKRHFLSPRDAPFYIYTNLAIVSLVYLASRHMRQVWQVLLPVSVFLGLYAGMILLQQNQPRYQQIVAVASFVTIALAWSRSGIRIPEYVLATVLVGNIALAGYLSLSAAGDARLERARLEDFKSQLNAVGLAEDARVAAFDLSPHSPLAVTIKPRQLLSIRTDMMDEESISEALAVYMPTHILASVASEQEQFVRKLDMGKAHVDALDKTYFGDLQLITLQQNAEKFLTPGPDDVLR